MNRKMILSMKGFLQLLLVIVKSKCSNLADTAVFIADTEFNFADVTIIMWKFNDCVDLTGLLTLYPGSVVTVSVKNNTVLATEQLLKTRIRQTIFVASKPECFEYIAKIIKKDVMVPPIAILILTEPLLDPIDITKATKAAWENDIGDIVVMTTDQEETKLDTFWPNVKIDNNYIVSLNDTIIPEEASLENKNVVNAVIKMWTYVPYGIGKCGDYTAVPLEVTGKTSFYPHKFRNFYGCPVRLSLLHFLPYVLLDKDENGNVTSIAGIDGKVLILALQTMNASLNVVSSVDHGGIGSFINGTGTGSYGDLVNGIADIFLPAVLLTLRRHSKAQISYVYESLDIYFCGPNRREIHAWAKAILPFFTNITPFILVTFVVFVIVIRVVRSYDLRKHVNKKGVCFMSFVMFLGQIVKFETNSWLVNSLFVLWIWFCMIVRIVYQGDLVNGFQKIILEPSLGTFDEAVEKLDGYGGLEVFAQFFANTSRANEYKVLTLAEIPVYIEDIANGKRFLLITDFFLVKWFKQTLQVLEEPLSRAHVCIYMRPGWPAALEVDRLLFIIAETGFVQKIVDDVDYEWLIQSEQSSESPEAQPLDMTTLGACFYGLLVIYAVCFVIFCGELICHKYGLKSKLKCKFKVKW